MSSVSTDKLSCGMGSGVDGSACLELALEGERLCKAGDCRAGVAYFEAAISAGTDDLRTLSAIYSQLGNAYFYLGDYVKAMQYHKHDLTLARTMGDKLGEAKASGNLGNTLKVMGKFDEAMICCKRHLEISQDLNDKVGEGRALYNLGNVYHAKGKHIGRLGQQDPGEFPEEVRSCLQQAVYYYEENLRLMRELGDTAAQGRACGNLGNTHYLLGNFSQSISYHDERLKIAREFGDKAAERRAHSNLGNANIFLGEFENAAEHYKRTLVLAQDLGDRAVEAQACYSLGNTYTLLRDYPTAVDYHLRHLRIAQELMDRVGEGRACWSLGNANSAMGNHEKALYFASKHLEISKEIGDQMGQATAQMNVGDLRKVLGLPAGAGALDCSALPGDSSVDHGDGSGSATTEPAAGHSPSSSSADWRNRLTPDGKQSGAGAASAMQAASSGSLPPPSPADGKASSGQHLDDEESFFELLSRFQSKRMDDQRCSLNVVAENNKENNVHLAQSSNLVKNNFALSNNNNVANLAGGDRVLNNSTAHKTTLNNANGNNKGPVITSNDLSVGNSGGEAASRLQDDLLDLIAGMQSKRMDEQRVALPHLPGLHPPRTSVHNASSSVHTHPALQHLTSNNTLACNPSDVPTTSPPDDSFFEMLMRCQSTRLEDQRSTLPANGEEASPPLAAPSRGPTVPDEDFFSLIMRLQSGRMEDQRAAVPLLPNSVQSSSASGGRQGEDSRFKGLPSSNSQQSSQQGNGGKGGGGGGSYSRKEKKK
ncbi:G-protein-signaling modulator 2 isoform X2 [Ischnura elegans]|uniref:G-protein-signaling modulator 2 isoform X2 n=1 Tax=Ischnura elegans TaxID=197161 RepID=UPI001ED8753C|nr:G-protein-signaling modulator 2 isoform X2 [Ischnura elegans]